MYKTIKKFQFSSLKIKVILCLCVVPLCLLTGCQAQQASRIKGKTLLSTANTIAFSQLTGDHWQIWTMRPDGTNAIQITTSPIDKRYPVWFDNGAKLLYRTNNSQIYSLDIDTGNTERLLGSFGLLSSVAPSPDNSKMLAIKLNPNLKDCSNLWLTTFDGKDKKALTTEIGFLFDSAWSANGRRIVYGYGTGYQKDELYIIDADGSNKIRLTKNKAIEVLPAFSPDGTKIAYACDITDDFEIWLMDADGSNQTQLTNNKGIDTKPCWSPDGEQIMFVSRRSGIQQIWIMNKDGSEPIQLTFGQESIEPTWRR